jgi:hypothetical protein
MSYLAPPSDGGIDLLLPEWERIFRRKPPRWRCFTASGLVHAMAVGAFFLPTLLMERPDRLPALKNATTIFTPPAPEPSEPAPPEPEVASKAAGLVQPRIQLPELPVPDAPVNLSSIELRIADDVHGQLPDVVRAQGGMLALLDKEDLTVSTYLFQAPEWEPLETTRDVSRMLRIEMYPPQMWAVFRDAADRHGIALDHYRAFALFGIAYRGCLQNAIRRSAKGARVSSAVLRVAPDSPCGFEVQEVTFAASPALHP